MIGIMFALNGTIKLFKIQEGINRKTAAAAQAK